MKTRTNKYNLFTNAAGEWCRRCPQCNKVVPYKYRNAALTAASDRVLCKDCHPHPEWLGLSGHSGSYDHHIVVELSPSEYDVVCYKKDKVKFFVRFRKVNLVCPHCGWPKTMNVPSDWPDIGLRCGRCHQSSRLNVPSGSQIDLDEQKVST